MTKIIFVAFGSSLRFSKAIDRIRKQAESFQMFDEIHAVNESHLDQHFWDRHQGFVDRYYSKGFGYWIWKSYITLKYMNEINDGDILCYCDVGCELNIEGKKRMNEYIDIVRNSDSGILSFSMPGLFEKAWCKMDLIHHLDCYEQMDCDQMLGGVFFITKTTKNLDLITKWYETCCDYHFIDDSQSILPNHESFCEHRHDQSVFSLLRNKFGTETLNTCIENKCGDKDKPIWTSRKDD
jgi:hypothetical protein